MLWVSQKYGSYTREAVEMAVTDLNKIAAGIHVERWGSKLELVR